MKPYLWIAATWMAACADGATVPVPSPTRAVVASDAPSVVIVLTDDMRPDLLRRSILPATFAHLVDSGTTYGSAYADSPICCPARTTLLTTTPQHIHGVLDNHGPGGGAPAFVAANLGTQTLATALQGAGYLTAIHGKWLNLYNQVGPQPYVSPGWDEWRVPTLARYWSYSMNERPFDSALVTRTYGTLAKDHLTNVLKRASRDLIARAPAGQPLFLLITPLAPHAPWTAQASDVGTCAAEPVTLTVEDDVSDKPAFVQALPALTPAQVAQAAADWRKQCETLRSVDRLVAEVIARLKATGRWHNTLFVFSSDNGLTMAEHRLFERKKSVYSAAIPLVIRYPGQTVPQVEATPVSLLDVSATVRALAGVPGTGYGVPLHQGLPPDVLIEHLVVQPANEAFRALRSGQWLYAEYPAGGLGGVPFVELYDLATDPHRLTNIAGDPSAASIRAILSARLAAKAGT